ncbi:MAG: GntR family transcriptional regulator, partial [Salinivirgaceae bacterium]
DPELIAKTFNVSKKIFKKAVGKLYKNKQIVIEEDGIKLVS